MARDDRQSTTSAKTFGKPRARGDGKSKGGEPFVSTHDLLELDVKISHWGTITGGDHTGPGTPVFSCLAPRGPPFVPNMESAATRSRGFFPKHQAPKECPKQKRDQEEEKKKAGEMDFAVVSPSRGVLRGGALETWSSFFY